MKDKKTILLVVLAVVAVLVWGGMMFASSRPVDPNAQFKPEELKAFNDLETKQRDIYKRAGGVFESMSPEDRKYFMEKHWDREEIARRTWAKYAAEASGKSGKSDTQMMGEAAKAAQGR